MSREKSQAPGAPGEPSLWNPGSKAGVGTAIRSPSSVWFTLGRGAIEETYFPGADRPIIRDAGFAVADGNDFFSWEKSDTDFTASVIEVGVPAYRLENRSRQGRYQVEKTICAHPDRPVVLQNTQFQPEGEGLGLYVITNPHLAEKADAWVGDYKGVPMLFASGGGAAVAVACSAPWAKRTVGFVGKSDGWHDLKKNKRLTRTFERAEGGNVVLTGQIEYPAGGEFLLVLGFGLDPDAAGLHAHAALFDGFTCAFTRYTKQWRQWQSHLPALETRSERTTAVYRASSAVLQTHQAKTPPGAVVASLAIPFGQARTGDDTGGYHLVWPRDLAECAGGLLAAGIHEYAYAALTYFAATQDPDGHWAQNTWLNGKPYWDGIQMDETALMITLLDLARREGAVKKSEAAHLWPVVRKAIGYLVCNGPYTPEDRWEHDGGYSPYTIAVEVAALLDAAAMAEENGEPELAQYLEETADVWNAGIERWTYVTGTDLARRVGVEGYYIRLGSGNTRGGPPNRGSSPRDGADESSVSPDALALVRFGLRRADDPRIVNTVKAIDAVLKVDLGYGPGWRRYAGDRYGEYPDGRPFDNKGGVGRAWPLLTGERGHYELAAGRPREAERMLHLMEKTATDTGLIPEQVWDAADIPGKDLFRGRSTTSACPLVWAHAEYIKLLRSIRDGAIFDQPRRTAQRYANGFTPPRLRMWRFNHKLRSFASGNNLRVEVQAPAVVRWSTDGWKQTHEVEARDTGLGLYIADLPTEQIAPGGELVFTFHWTENGKWEKKDFHIPVVESEPKSAATDSGAAG